MRVLLALLAISIGIIAGLVTGILCRISGGHPADAARRGCVACGGTITVVILLMNAAAIL